MTQDVLVIDHISRSYRKKEVLRDISFSAGKGSCTGIVGINGGGKSTLLSILAGIRKPSGGSFYCFGKDMLRHGSAFSDLIAYLPQDDPLLSELTVRDNLRLWSGGRSTDRLEVLEKLQLKELLDQRVKELSGGMKRRLSIACAVCRNQPVLIMDEPSSALDLHQKAIIRDYIKEYTRGGGVLIISTHDPQEIAVCDNLYYLEDGTLIHVNYEEAVSRLREGVE